jgi:hypothetical protein
MFTTGEKHFPSQGQVLFPNSTSLQTIGPAATPAPPSLTKIWIAGCITYLDQFETPHWSRYCYEMGNGQRPVGKGSPVEPCQLFNDTDETQSQNMDQEIQMMQEFFKHLPKK